MYFLLDENVPNSIARFLEADGHAVSFARDLVPLGSPDPVVATMAEEMGAVFVSLDGDFQKIAPRASFGRRRFRNLSRIWLRCHEPRAAQRMEAAISLIEFEYELAQARSDKRMIIRLGNDHIRMDR